MQQSDRLAARDEHDLHAPVEFKPIEEVFIRNAHVMFVSIAGRRIGTTAEHPFYVQGRGWTPAGELALGDLVPSHDGQWNPVTALDFTGEIRRVYNFRIADHRTYFVGDDDWGFSVWVHNAKYSADVDEVLKLSHQGIQNPARRGASSKSLLGSEIHHIASDKGVGDGNRWADVFEHLFQGARMSLQNPMNLIRLPGHAGPHGILNQVVFDRLMNATSAFAHGSSEYRRALRIELAFMRKDLRDSSTLMGTLARARGSGIAEAQWSMQQSRVAASRLGI